MKNTDNTTHQATEALSKPVTADTAQDMLADRLPVGLFAPYLMTAVALAMAYGSSFLLADTLRAAGYAASTAGSIVSVGTVATLVGSLFAGRLAERTGILPLVAVSASIMAAAMACFAMIGTGGLPLAYVGGLLLGLGWAIFYMLAPIQIIHCLKPSARLEALTLLSGSQMLGIGVSAPLGRVIAEHFGGPGNAYAFYAAFCALAAAFSLMIRKRMAVQPQLPMRAVALSVPATLSILRAKTVAPVIMMGIAACTFAGLSTFQSLYADSRGMTPDIFFLTFTVTTVALRFSVASMIGRLPLGRLVFALFVATLLGIGLLVANAGSSVIYILATILFATGYGLTYSTLNAMVVNLAGERGLSIPVASQVFTLGYFVGLFGFPYFAGSLIATHGIDTALLAMIGLVTANIAIAVWMLHWTRTKAI
ncbi:MFS transporter [Agrobacterium tumefaciens]|uniref:MFS transporter n=1 Tax=Agrobacterium tumefaciens TaxID=358 RepID=A0AA44F787_AGRTU|nr:MFS transporter [Agrobacterium tumefaciens]NTB87670.1 MFS transporter [Agrobacterium tumefaciens]NTC19962.1 MFS transporter [Agrobacterium tumefaciens]NTC29781.1 MFS transporter [Agrobacterium tumefaciens]